MKMQMKKLFTIDDFAVAFISALGYGFGETVARLLGWPGPACIVACFAVGIAVEELISKIIFSKPVQRKTINRVLIYVIVLLVFLTGQYIAVSCMGVSMVDYVVEEFAYVVGLPIVGLILNLFIRSYHIRKIRKLYGDGSEGYVFDVAEEDIEELNRKNQPVLGEYDADCAVKTRTGIYVGDKQKKIISYRGIPYAKPPIGELRWKAPEPLPSSEDVFEAIYFGASAIQVDHKGVILQLHRQSEDCLTLNIITGAERTETKKPVLVLFHHGDYSYGGSADPLLDGDNFITEHPDIIFVSFNYRLGIFGFIDFSEVTGGENFPDAPNLGLLDQIEALKWIRENIAAFGGDPENITVMGFEDGASSITLLAVSERAKGLFQKAFVFVGSPVSAYDTPETSRALAGDLLRETHTTSMEELLQLNTETLKEAAGKLWKYFCAPTCDGKLISVNPYKACQEGAASGIEFIIGIPCCEKMVFRSFIGDRNYEKLVYSGITDIQNSVDDTVFDAVQEYINKQTASSSEFEVKAKLFEQWLAVSAYRFAVNLSEAGNKVHLMYWDRTPLIDKLGSGTVDAEAEMLGNGEALRMYGNVMDKNMSETLQTFLYKYVKGNALKLYRNEIYGVSDFEWRAFPKALIVSDDELECDRIEDRVTEVKELQVYMKSNVS